MDERNGWLRRHVEALERPIAPFESAVVLMSQAWGLYALGHRNRYGSSIGEDGVLGPDWASIGRALLGLLNGETGRLDGGTLDGWVRETMRTNGVEDAD